MTSLIPSKGRRALILAPCALAATLALAPWAHAESIDQVYEAAKQEGKVVFWSALDGPVVRDMAAAFNKEYPGIEVEHFEIQPGPALQRIVSEAQAGQVTVDAYDTPLSYLPLLTERGLMDTSTDWKGTFGVSDTEILADGGVLHFYDLDVPIAINTSVIEPDSVKGWDDLTKPEMKGKVIVESRGIAFVMLSEAWGEERTHEYLAKLLDNDPIIIRGGTPVGEALAGGQAGAAVGTYSGRVQLYKEMGAPVDWVPVDPIPTMLYVAGVPKGAPHPNAGKLWVYWLSTSEAAQHELYEGHRFGRLTGDNISPAGERVKEAGASVVYESEDLAKSRRLLESFSGQIAAH